MKGVPCSVQYISMDPLKPECGQTTSNTELDGEEHGEAFEHLLLMLEILRWYSSCLCRDLRD